MLIDEKKTVQKRKAEVFQPMPFVIKSPNKITREAMTAARNGKGLEKVSLKELSDEWEDEKYETGNHEAGQPHPKMMKSFGD